MSTFAERHPTLPLDIYPSSIDKAAYRAGLIWAEVSEDVEFADLSAMNAAQRLAFREGYFDGCVVAARSKA